MDSLLTEGLAAADASSWSTCGSLGEANCKSAVVSGLESLGIAVSSGVVVVSLDIACCSTAVIESTGGMTTAEDTASDGSSAACGGVGVGAMVTDGRLGGGGGGGTATAGAGVEVASIGASDDDSVDSAVDGGCVASTDIGGDVDRVSSTMPSVS